MALTPEEKQHLFHRMTMWREECDFQANQYETLGKALNIVPLRVEMAAAYFIMAAGCVYYHAAEILEHKLGTQRGRKHLKQITEADPDLQAIMDRRNWLNHGIVSSPKNPQRDKAYSMSRNHHAAIESDLATGQSKTISYSLGWADIDINDYKDMFDWHKKACDALDRLLDDDAILPPVCSATEDTPQLDS